MTRLRIVLALPELPLPFGSAGARWYYVLLKTLTDAGHDVVALAPYARASDAEQARALFPAPRFDLRCHAISAGSTLSQQLHTMRWPFSSAIAASYRADLAGLMRGRVDVLQIEQLSIGWLALAYPQQAVVNVHYLVSIDWSTVTGGSWKQRAIRHAARRAEARLLRQHGRFLTLSPRLTGALRTSNPRARVETVPMALDLSLYPFDAQVSSNGDSPPTLGLIGSFNWWPSRNAGTRLITRLWPEILARVPNAHLQIVGRQAQQAFADLPAPLNTTFYSDVPGTTPYFRSTDVLLYAPPAGSGMKVKVMEAFALGTAVVTNADGIEGMPAIDHIHAGVGTSDAALIERAVNLLTHPQQRSEQARAARALMEAECDPATVRQRLMTAYSRLGLASSADDTSTT